MVSTLRSSLRPILITLRSKEHSKVYTDKLRKMDTIIKVLLGTLNPCWYRHQLTTISTILLITMITLLDLDTLLLLLLMETKAKALCNITGTVTTPPRRIMK